MVVERSPSSVLLLLHAEHSAGPDDGQGLPDDCRDELAPEAEGLDQLQSAEARWESIVWDASGGARRGAMALAALQLPPHSADDAGKSAGQGPDAPALDAHSQSLHFVQQAQPDAAEPYTQDAARSAERSFAAQAVAALQVPEASQGARTRLELAKP